MARALFVKKLHSLFPAEEAAEEIMRSLAMNSEIMVEIRKPRNPEHHRKLFAMLNIVLQNQSFYHNVEELLDVAKLSIGHYEVRQSKNEIWHVPKSISFASMDQTNFNEFYDRVVDWVCDTVIPGLSSHGLKEEVEMELLSFG